MESSLPILHWPAGLHILAYLGLLILVALVLGRLANLLGLPKIMGYLLAGILLGPSVLGVLSQEIIQEKLTLVTDIALAIIAFSIGGALQINRIKVIGKSLTVITFSQVLGAFFTCTLVLGVVFYFLNGKGESIYWPAYYQAALIMGAVAVATAPAAILAMVKEYRARGPMTEALLGVVAIDDAIALVLFSLVVTFLQIPETGWGWPLIKNLSLTLLTIAVSLGLGGALGLIRKYLNKFFPDPESLFGVVAGFLFLTTGLAHSLGASPLLSAMTLGLIVGNFVEKHETVFQTMDEIEGPIIALFFSLAGAYLDFSVLKIAGGITFIYVLARFFGKYLGTWFGATITKSPPMIRKYLGLALLPKAGVTLGLILNAEPLIPDPTVARVMVNVVIGSTLINELLTPLMVHYALTKAGEVQDKKSFHIRHM